MAERWKLLKLFSKKHKEVKEDIRAKEEVEEYFKDKSEVKEDNNKEETYGMEYKCDNCGDTISWDIPKGTKVSDYLKDEICDGCGCKIYRCKIVETE